jgi:hypothetical protein
MLTKLKPTYVSMELRSKQRVECSKTILLLSGEMLTCLMVKYDL